MDGWDGVERLVNGMREGERPPMPMEEIQSVVGWIPPRVVSRVTAASTVPGRVIRGVYIDTFIPPDQLRRVQANRARILDAARCAEREGAAVVSLGGFTSILMEGGAMLQEQLPHLPFTTGNTLTTQFIIDGVQEACRIHGVTVRDARVMIIGATGDIGSACARWFAPRVRKILLCARNQHRLDALHHALIADGAQSQRSTDPAELLGAADIVIGVAGLTDGRLAIDKLSKEAIICDAGYPHNLDVVDDVRCERLFHGGMGEVIGGFHGTNGLLKFYRHPLPNIAHGCMAEGMLLAMERCHESFSYGRGNITPDRIQRMREMAERHGFRVAPPFNHHGLWAPRDDTGQPSPEPCGIGTSPAR